MKKIWILGMFFFCWDSGAYFVPGGEIFSKQFQQTQKRVQIEISHSHQVSAQLHQYIKNISNQPQTLQLIESLPFSAKNIDFYANSAGEKFEILQGISAREKLFSFASDFQDHRYFRLTKDEQTNVFLSPEITFQPGQEIHFKISFVTQAQKTDDFFSFDLFLQDDIPSNTFELALSLIPGFQVHHFLSNLSSQSLTDITSHRVTMLLKKAHFTPDTNFRIWWSDREKATLTHWFQDFLYQAIFIPLSPQRDIREVTILLDTSGSMTGETWERAKDWISYLLEFFGSNRSIRIGFFDSDLEWYNEKFEENNFQFQKTFASVLRSMKPVGKTDMTNVFSQIQDDWHEDFLHRATVLIGDTIEFVSPQILPSSLISLHFSDDQTSDIKSLSELSGGFSIPLFSSAFTLVEKTEFEKKWNHWRQKISFPSSNSNSVLSELLPQEFRSGVHFSSPFFVGRNYKPFHASVSQVGTFLPTVWGKRRISEILHHQNFSLEMVDALLSIGRTFGVMTRFFDSNTTRNQLLSTFNLHADQETLELEIQKEIWNQESFNKILPSQVAFMGSTPLYPLPHLENPEFPIWRQFNFETQVKVNTLIDIAPFSQAQKELFVRFPEFVAEGFGIEKAVDFCTPFRCISVRTGNREYSIPKDRAFFRDFDPAHWAAKYAIQAIDRELLEPELNGKLHLDRAVDRGVFSEMVVKTYFPEMIHSVNGSTFVDLKPGDDFHDAVEILVQKGILRGYPDGTFRPLQSLTRAEAVKILLASHDFIPDEKYPENTPQVFPDVIGWEKSWISEAVKRNIVQGYSDGTFRPHQDLTKAEAIKLLLSMKNN
jgi:hypothetical protein